MSRTSTLAMVVATALLGPAALPGAASARTAEPAVAVPEGGALHLTGHGYGHGRGMSQYGAEGAARQGLTSAQIIGFYYPGTTIARATGKISVRIGADTTTDTVVAANSRLVARVVGKPSQSWSLPSLRRDATRWRLKPVAGGRTVLAYQVPGHSWARAKVLDGTAEFFAGGAPITLYVPGGSAAYRGALRNAPAGDTDRDTVNVVGLENYVRGVVAREMPSGWSAAALQAQAVAARTYAAYDRAHAPASRSYQTCDSTSCQVYGGVAAETRATDAAVAATNGQVVTYAGQLAFTQFSSSSGGWTVRGSVPYQAAKADPYDAWAGNRVHDWTATVTAAQVQAAWPSIGTLTGVQVLDRDGNGDWGGRIGALRLTGSKGAVTVDGTDFRMRLGLRSTWLKLG
ncbi:SpoIID/LytB domain-containing protein [Nocardioides sp. CER19]|uniref:SpoIID/LytB domain-containing protein n=1 Tax=Nocardioides sp. CER19 TaxID=3038538 RepID=UPI00244B8A60|nr:SpoIID/LytB domain-containing protein [Nocardioides sp. CER19]MDH2413718.1 SpoIID/LytB domain-containing protein [Nocardioides sp. CER19]